MEPVTINRLVKPCPFCGSPGVETKHDYVQCSNSGCSFGIVGTSEVSAVELWNR